MKRTTACIAMACFGLLLPSCGSHSSFTSDGANRVCRTFAHGHGTLNSSVVTHTSALRRVNSVEHLHLDAFINAAPSSVALCIFDGQPTPGGNPAACSQSGVVEYVVTPDGSHSSVYPCS
jgi:hypothetical protein